MTIYTPHGRDSRTLRWDKPAPLGLVEDKPILPGSRLWVVGKKPDLMSIIASVDRGYMHVSVAHSSRYPTWDEIHTIRDWAFPEDMEVVMVLPREVDYVNLHRNCFHLWESACGEEGR